MHNKDLFGSSKLERSFKPENGQAVRVGPECDQVSRGCDREVDQVELGRVHGRQWLQLELAVDADRPGRRNCANLGIKVKTMGFSYLVLVYIMTLNFKCKVMVFGSYYDF